MGSGRELGMRQFVELGWNRRIEVGKIVHPSAIAIDQKREASVVGMVGEKLFGVRNPHELGIRTVSGEVSHKLGSPAESEEKRPLDGPSSESCEKMLPGSNGGTKEA
jgi:hypothetical protein